MRYMGSTAFPSDWQERRVRGHKPISNFTWRWMSWLVMLSSKPFLLEELKFSFITDSTLRESSTFHLLHKVVSHKASCTGCINTLQLIHFLPSRYDQHRNGVLSTLLSSTPSLEKIKPMLTYYMDFIPENFHWELQTGHCPAAAVGSHLDLVLTQVIEYLSKGSNQKWRNRGGNVHRQDGSVRTW